jgi:anti-sigma-K factor RskA
LKATDASITLDVFDGKGNTIIKVHFIQNTNAYAITIEPDGGSQSPNLNDLIRAFSI